MLATRVLAPNPSPMTLEGTNTYLLRRPDSYKVVVVDPGPLNAVHLRRVVSLGLVEMIVLTHHHADHTQAAQRLSMITGAPVRSFDESLCVNAPSLSDGEELIAGGIRIRVIATPGHTRDSICIHLPDDRQLQVSTDRGSMLTGDTILGRGTTVIAQPDGSLRDYLATLERLVDFGRTTVLPGHGPMLDDLGIIARAYLTHRRERLRNIATTMDALRASDDEITVTRVTDLVYRDITAPVRFAAEASVKAQLQYLMESAPLPNERRRP